MPEDAGSAFTGTFNSVYGAYLNSSKMQLQEQSNKMEQYSTFGKLLDMYKTDPGVAEPIATDFMKQMQVPDDTSKLLLKAFKDSSDQTRDHVKDLLLQQGMKADAPTISQILKAGPANIMTAIGQMRTAQGMQATGAALNEDPSSGGASPPAGSPAPAASPTAAPAAPPGQLEAGNINLNNRPVVKNSDGSVSTVRSIGINDGGKEVVIPTVSDDGRVMSNDEAVAQYRSSGKHLGKFDTVDNANAYGQKLHEAQATQYAPPATPMPPAVQAAVGAPPATAMPGMPDGHAAPDATHPVTDAPAYSAAQQYDKMMRAATRLESNRNPDGSPKPSYPEQAQKLRDEAEKVSKGAVINLPSTDPRVKGLGLLPGTVVSYNTATRQMTSIQNGYQTWNTLDPKDPKNADLYSNQKPGTIIAKNAQTGEYGVKVTGADMVKPATPAQLKSLGIDAASIPAGTSITMDATGKPTSQQLVPEQEVPVTADRRAQLVSGQGINLNPNLAYTENKTTGKISAIQTGQTSEGERVALAAKSDQKELDEQRDNLTKSAQTIATNKVVRNLVQKYGTGPAGDIKLLVGQLADQFGVKMPKGLDIDTSAGEALRATLGNKVVDQAMSLSGQKSAREMQLLKQNSGNLLLTSGGNELITKISDWAANQSTAVGNLANNWEGPLTSKAASGPYAGKNYYQAKAEILSQQGLPPELKEGIQTEVNNIKDAKAVLPKISTATEQELRTLSQYGGLMTKLEKKRAEARWTELGLQ